jgi:hypothetical protein
MAGLHPAARKALLFFGRAGYKALAAGIKVGLGEVRAVGEEMLARTKHAEAEADRMSRGEPYRRADEETKDSPRRPYR